MKVLWVHTVARLDFRPAAYGPHRKQYGYGRFLILQAATNQQAVLLHSELSLPYSSIP